MREVLKVEALRINAIDKRETVTIIDDISFKLEQGETLGIVGESGCGKSITALGIIGLLKKNQVIDHGSILFKGKELTSMSKGDLRNICGKEIGMIFQEPMTALNPFFSIGRQLREPLILHMNMTKSQASKRSIELLEEVGIKNAETVLKSYPHQFSGGMRQRVLIAIAISCNPSLLIADEPTTALDVIIQAQILRILKRLIKNRNMSLLLISHDFGVISQMSKKIGIMYAGELVEEGRVEDMMTIPNHPYTKALLSAAKEMNSSSKTLTVLKGSVPRPGMIINGCRFADRCNIKTSICEKQKPKMIEITPSTWVRCWNVKDARKIGD